MQSSDDYLSTELTHDYNQCKCADECPIMRITCSSAAVCTALELLAHSRIRHPPVNRIRHKTL